MNEFQRQYIECSKRYREKEDADSVRALYALKESLEAESAPEAKRVLVDVYDLLDFKKSAYELVSGASRITPRTGAIPLRSSARKHRLRLKKRASGRKDSRFSATTRIRWRPVCFKR